MTRWLTASVVLGATPLVTGLSIFLLWLLVRWDWLMLAGGFTIFGGLVCVAAGVLCLAVYWMLARRQQGVPSPTRRVVAVSFLLLVNFPVALGIAVAGIHIDTRYTVEVRNESSSIIHRVEVFGGGVQVTFGSIPAGESREKGFHFTEDGELSYRLVHDGKEHGGRVEGYVTGGLGGHRTLVVQPDGEVSVR